MQAIRNILIVLNPEQPEMLAFKRAREIASRDDGRANPPQPEAIRPKLHLLVCDDKADHSSLLERLAAELTQEGFAVSTQQAWHRSVHQTIAIAQQATGCDLVIKQHQPDNPLKKALLTPEDWKLLRYCPAQVLMVKTGKPWSSGRILAAIDIGNPESEHRALHESILQYGQTLAELTRGELHVVCARPAAMLSASDPTIQIAEEIEARYREGRQAFQSRYGIADDRLHVAEGPADTLIPQFAADLQAEVTVIGTVARTGLSGALIGNTAEVVLDALESDVLVIKPAQVMEELEEMVTHF